MLWDRLLKAGYQGTAEFLQSRIKSRFDSRVDTWAALTTAIHYYLNFFNFQNTRSTHDENTPPCQTNSWDVDNLDYTDFHRRV